MTARHIVVLALLALAPLRVAWPQPLDGPSTDALADTLRLLQSQGSVQLDPRLAAIENSPELTKEFYEVAGAVFTDIVQRCGGDPQRMTELIDRAKSDPAGFAEMLTPPTRARLTALVDQLSAQQR